jgi:hypothetical protein
MAESPAAAADLADPDPVISPDDPAVGAGGCGKHSRACGCRGSLAEKIPAGDFWGIGGRCLFYLIHFDLLKFSNLDRDKITFSSRERQLKIKDPE